MIGTVQMTGRGDLTKFQILFRTTVDDAVWYTVSCCRDVSVWVRENGVESKEWHEHIDSNWYVHMNVFDMHEELYTILVLRWQ